MRGEEVILLNFPISHFLKSLAHSAVSLDRHRASAETIDQSDEQNEPHGDLNASRVGLYGNV